MNKSLLIIIISLLVHMVNMVVVSPVYAQTGTILYVDPPSIRDKTKTPGTNFAVNINVKNVTDLFGYDFKLFYNTALLDVTTVTVGSFFPPDSKIVTELKDTLGYVRYNVTMPLGSVVGKTGSGILATITFTVDSIGESSLDLRNTKLIDSGGRLIEHDTVDGFFSNKPVYAMLYVDPPSIIDTTKTAGTNFAVNINVKNVTDLFGYSFKLFYNTALLDVTTVTVGSFFPNPFVMHAETNEEKGYVYYGVLMPFGSPVGVSGSGTLLTISFNVTSTGETILDLNTLEIFNSWEEDITHIVYDGYFSNILRYTKLYIEPKNTINPSLTLGANFTINVNIFNATDLYGYKFFLNYTTDILTATNVTLGSFFPSELTPPVIWHEEINDTLGYIWYNVTMPLDAPSGILGSGTLATINFTVDFIGETPLDLCNTKLVNSQGEEIEYDTLDGYFSNKPIIHDIAITNVTTTVTTVVVEEGGALPVSRPVSEVHSGEKVNVTVSVKNNGTISETFNVTAYYSDTIIGTPMNVTLSDGFKTSLVFEWNTEGVAPGDYTIWAEASPVPGETLKDRGNNKFIMEGAFKVLASPFPIELVVVAAVAIVSIIAVTAVYFIKIRKPKLVAEGTLSQSKG